MVLGGLIAGAAACRGSSAGRGFWPALGLNPVTAARRANATAVQIALLGAGRKPASPAVMHYLCKQRDRNAAAGSNKNGQSPARPAPRTIARPRTLEAVATACQPLGLAPCALPYL
jgi:hypothetical protein